MSDFKGLSTDPADGVPFAPTQAEVLKLVARTKFSPLTRNEYRTWADAPANALIAYPMFKNSIGFVLLIGGDVVEFHCGDEHVIYQLK